MSPAVIKLTAIDRRSCAVKSILLLYLVPNAKYTDKARYSDYTFFRIAILGYLLFKHLQLRVIEKRNIDFSIRF